jgi:hypothetical protein
MMTAAFTESTIESAALHRKLLPKLIRGELRVKDVERFLGRAM